MPRWFLLLEVFLCSCPGGTLSCARWNYERLEGIGGAGSDGGLSRVGDGGLGGTGSSGRLADSGPAGAGGTTALDAGAGSGGSPPNLGDLGPFTTPRLIDELVTPGETADDPSFTDDRLLLFFNSSRAGGLGNGDIWYSTRISPDLPWGAPQLSSVSSAARETTPGVSRDGLSLWFSSDRGGAGACTTGGGLDVWVATREGADDDFGPPVCVEELSGPNDEVAPALSADGRALVLTVEDGSFSQLYLATRQDPGQPFDEPSIIVELSGPHDDGDAVLARRGRELFLATNRDESGSSLALATRASDNAPFGPLVYLDELNGPGVDSDPWISSDSTFVIWASDRSGTQQLYQASR